jgi:hypothetical protein
MTADSLTVRTSVRVERFDPEQGEWAARKADRDFSAREADVRHFRHYGVQPYQVTEDFDCNLVTAAGWAALLGGIAGSTIGAKFTAASARIGIGSAITAPSTAQSFLNSDTGSGSTTSYYQLVSIAPVIVTAQPPPFSLSFTATFGPAVANFPWNEFGTDNGTASGVTAQGLGTVLLNAGQSPQGTKPPGDTWVIIETLNCGYASGPGSVD